MSAKGLEVVYVSVSTLRPYSKNSRTHSPWQIAQIAASIQEFGFVNPILVDGKNGVVAGHGRLDAALKLGMERIPMIKLAHLTDAQRRALILADNKLAENAGWDEELLAAELESLKLEDYDLGVIGFGDAELEKLLEAEEPAAAPEPKIDRAAELQTKWGTARGQLWLIGKHRLLCGDSTLEADVERLMNGERAVLFATDPPYLVAYDGTNHPHKWNESEELKRRKNKDWSDKYTDIDSPEMGEKLYDAFVAVAVKCAIAEDAAWYCWHASRKQALLEAVWEKHGAFVHQQIIWIKDRPILTRSWYMWQHEPCFFGWKKSRKPQRVADDYPPTVWQFPTHAAGATTDHPTQKPVELFAIPIRQHTKRGEVCYEPFSGSGTQLCAAEQLERVCYAIEKSPPFVAVALERLHEMGLKPVLKR